MLEHRIHVWHLNSIPWEPDNCGGGQGPGQMDGSNATLCQIEWNSPQSDQNVILNRIIEKLEKYFICSKGIVLLN